MPKTQSKADNSRLKRTAYHEAGHAVAAVIKRLPFDHVTINPDDAAGALGRVLFSKLSRRFRPDIELTLHGEETLRNHVLCSYAGPAGAGLLAGRDFDWTGAEQDKEAIYAMLYRLESEPEAIAALQKWLQLRARNLIKARRRAVELVAGRLLLQRTMSFAEVRDAWFEAGRMQMMAMRPQTGTSANS